MGASGEHDGSRVAVRRIRSRTQMNEANSSAEVSKTDLGDTYSTGPAARAPTTNEGPVCD